MIDFLDGYLRDDDKARARLEKAGAGTGVGAVGPCSEASRG